MNRAVLPQARVVGAPNPHLLAARAEKVARLVNAPEPDGRCVECGADEGETCATVGGEPYCGPCFQARQRAKSAAKLAGQSANERAVVADEAWRALAEPIR